MERILSDKETTFINRAIKKITQLTENLNIEISNNDVTHENVQLILELELVITTLQNYFCDWVIAESDYVVDFFTIKANLFEIPFVSLSNPIIYQGNSWATIQNLEIINQNSISRDLVLHQLILQGLDFPVETDPYQNYLTTLNQ